MPPVGRPVSVKDLVNVQLVLLSTQHGLRPLVNAAFEQAGVAPRFFSEIDGFPVLMGAVEDGMAATIQPGAAIGQSGSEALHRWVIADKHARRVNLKAAATPLLVTRLGV